jgi:predicted hydrocarbon binding protein
VHGIIFFYIQKFADEATSGKTTWLKLRETVTATNSRYLPNEAYPDTDAIQLLQKIADTCGEPLPNLIERFGEFLAPHLIKVAGQLIDPSWQTLDLIENTESIIHTMVRSANPGAEPPVLETVRHSPNELHLVYSSGRQLCLLAKGVTRGLARHYNETVMIEETSCMHKGDPFCCFVIQDESNETHSTKSPLSETIAFDPHNGSSLSPQITNWHSNPSDPLGTPETIDSFSVKSVIGSGGMGRVYRGYDSSLDRDIAIKVMHPSRAKDDVSRKRFLRESKTTASINHPSIVTIYQIGEHDNLPYIAMQYIDGPNLSEYRTQFGGAIPVPEVVRIGREISEGLAAAHQKNLVHRDIKPDNILLEGPQHHVQIIDFGLAHETGNEESRLTVNNSVIGTPAYMSPERIGTDEVDAKSDLFGLGVILYEMISGKLPFDGKSMVSILAAISRGKPTAIDTVVPGIPKDLAILVMQLLSNDRAERPVDAHSVVEQLRVIEKQGT